MVKFNKLKVTLDKITHKQILNLLVYIQVGTFFIGLHEC